MATIIRCSCGKKIRIQEKYFGHRVRCPACGAIHVERPPGAEAVPIALPVEAPPLARPVDPAEVPLFEEPAAQKPQGGWEETVEIDERVARAPADHARDTECPPEARPPAAPSAATEVDWDPPAQDDFADLVEEKEPPELAEDDIDIAQLLAEDEAPAANGELHEKDFDEIMEDDEIGEPPPSEPLQSAWDEEELDDVEEEIEPLAAADEEYPRIWTNPKTGQFVALTETEAALTTLKKADLKQAEQELREGTPLDEVLENYADKKRRGAGSPALFPLTEVQAIRYDLKRTYAEVELAGEDGTQTSSARFAHKKQRDEFVAALLARVGPDWEESTVRQSRLRAVLLPLVVMLLVAAPLVIFYSVKGTIVFLIAALAAFFVTAAWAASLGRNAPHVVTLRPAEDED
jgi:hypothetical protein